MYMDRIHNHEVAGSIPAPATVEKQLLHDVCNCFLYIIIGSCPPGDKTQKRKNEGIGKNNSSKRFVIRKYFLSLQSDSEDITLYII